MHSTTQISKSDARRLSAPVPSMSVVLETATTLAVGGALHADVTDTNSVYPTWLGDDVEKGCFSAMFVTKQTTTGRLDEVLT